MRIGLITPGFSADERDWAIPALQTLATAVAQEHDLHVFSLRYPEAGRYQWDDFSHRAVGGGQRFGFASVGIWRQSVRAVVEAHRQRPFDVLHAFWADEPGLVAVMAGARIKRPVVVSIGGGELSALADIDYGTRRSFIRRQITRLALKQANAITAGSSYQLNLAQQQGLDMSKTQQVPLGVDIKRFRPTVQLMGIGPTIVQAASLTPVKNQGLLLDILALVKQEIPEIRLRVAGDGPLRPVLEAKAKHLGVEKHVQWAGAVLYEEMAAFFQQGHLYLQSSRHESQGMAVLEAMACGLPVLGTPVGVTAELAHLAATDDAAKLAAQVVQTLGNTVEYQALRRRVRQCILDHYSLDNTVQRFVALYEELSR